jgi:DNA-binding MarR family transcriptional regulator
MQRDLFARPLSRRGDPATSHAAAARAADLKAAHQRIVLEALRKFGAMGKDAIAARTRLDSTQIGRRLAEIERAGLIEPTGRTVQSLAGRQEREWRIKG